MNNQDILVFVGARSYCISMSHFDKLNIKLSEWRRRDTRDPHWKPRSVFVRAEAQIVSDAAAARDIGKTVNLNDGHCLNQHGSLGCQRRDMCAASAKHKRHGAQCRVSEQVMADTCIELPHSPAIKVHTTDPPSKIYLVEHVDIQVPLQMF